MSWDKNRFQSTLFRAERIPERPTPEQFMLPKELKQAKSLANRLYRQHQSREEVFLAQARLLERYEPEQGCEAVRRTGVMWRYYTYEALDFQSQLNYFAWRTKVRRGQWEPSPGSFPFLYAYELLNQIGVDSPMDGCEKLTAMTGVPSLPESLQFYLRRWLRDYVIYYNLPVDLLEQRKEDGQRRQVRALWEGTAEERMAAVKALSTYRLDRSRFYGRYQELFDMTALRVLDRVREQYPKHRKHTMEEDFFGVAYCGPTRLFEGAVFLPQGRQEDREYRVDEDTSYQCEDGEWYVERFQLRDQQSRKLGDLMKTVDCELREAVHFPRKLKPVLSTKWLVELVCREVAACVEQWQRQQALRRFDLSQLSRIRSDAEQTRERLMTEAEQDLPQADTAPVPPPVPDEPPQPPAPAGEDAGDARSLLTGEEYRLLHCLLYGGDTDWVRQAGLMLSVLTEGINEKLYDAFGDTVLEETEVVEDYREELKEMVQP